MNQFQAWWSERAAGHSRKHGAQSMRVGEPPRSDRDPAEKVAAGVSALAGQTLTRQEEDYGGRVVHYAFGTSVGALYGCATEGAPWLAAGLGLPFGAAVWVAADLAAVPLLGLSKPPTEYPAWINRYALAAHLVYGLTTEGARRCLRRYV
jgi:uncharacterized membrane protein YagU involved in acid resistance